MSNLIEKEVFFNLSDVDLSILRCKYCRMTKTDNIPKCNQSPNECHEIDQKIIDDQVDIIFRKFLDNIIATKDIEKVIKVNEKMLDEKDIADKTENELKNIIRVSACVDKLIESCFDHSCIMYLTELDNIERAHISKLNRSRSKNKTLERDLKHKFFSDQVSDKLWNEFFSKPSKAMESIEFNKFMNENFPYFFEQLLSDKRYQDFIFKFTGTYISIDDLKEVYKNFLKYQFIDKKGDSAPIFTYEIVKQIIKLDTILYKLDGIEKIHDFISILKNINNLSENEYSDFIFYLKYMIQVKLMKQTKNFLINRPPNRNFKNKYMQNYVSTHVNGYNFTYDMVFPKFVLNYKYTLRHEGLVRDSIRSVVYVNTDKKTPKKVIDFYNMYGQLNTDNDIRQIIYKEHDTYKIKLFKEDYEETHQVGMNDDLFGIYFESGSKIIFDLLSNECFFTGTSEEIKFMIKKLEQNRIYFTNPIYAGFKGVFTIETTGFLCKKIIQEFFLKGEMSRYWITKSQQTSANNHIFLYWPENIIIPKTTEKNISLKIDFNSKVDIIYNKWDVSFEGDESLFIIPFLAMFMGFIHLMENLPYNKKYEKVYKVIKETGQYMRKRNIENHQKWSDISSALISQNEIAKREIYSRAMKNSMPNAQKYVEKFNSRSKPIIYPMKRFTEDQIAHRWKKFYLSVFLNINQVFVSDKSELQSPSKEDYDKAKKSISWVTGWNHMQGIAREQNNQKSFYTVVITDEFDNKYMMLSYPDKGKISNIEFNSNGIPCKGNVHGIVNGKVSAHKVQNQSSRKKHINPQIQSALSRIVSIAPTKSGFYFPKMSGYTTFRQFIYETYPDPDRRNTLLYQHTWDYSDEDREKSFATIDPVIHTDLLQDFHEAIIFCFGIDPVTKQFVIIEPRHRFSYSYNMDYDKVMFIFKHPHGDMDIVYFDDDKYTIPITPEIRNMIRNQNQNPITIKWLKSNVTLIGEEFLRGQFFDANGKSIGIRVIDRTGTKIMDLRYTAQFGLYYENDPLNHLIKATDTQTNVSEKFGIFANDDRFELIPRKTTFVKYKVSEIYETQRREKQEIYIFFRVLFTLWFIENNKNSIEKIYTEEDVRNFIEKYIHPTDPTRIEVPQKIEEIIVFKKYDTMEKMTKYLENIYPNRFYNDVLHVNASEIDKIKEYFYRELLLVKNYPKDFENYFTTERMKVSLIKKELPEINGFETIFYRNILAEIKKLKLSEKSYLFMRQFSPTVDINYGDKNSKDIKAELVIIPFRGKYYFIRMTSIGSYSVAANICDLWAKKKEIGSYYSTERKNISFLRKFIYEESTNMIVESRHNESDNILASGDDYWVLIYKLKAKSAAVAAAMLEIQI